jgi:AbrB family looped-hinge helix DNA binding protein
MVVSMAKTRINTKGQVTVPKGIRERLGLRTGDELEFIEEDGVFLFLKRLSTAPLRKYRDYLKDLAGRNPDEVVHEMRGQ